MNISTLTSARRNIEILGGLRWFLVEAHDVTLRLLVLLAQSIQALSARIEDAEASQQAVP